MSYLNLLGLSPQVRTKIRSSLSHIDPAFLYLSGFFVFVGLVCLVGNAVLPAPGSQLHRQFPAESEVRGDVRMGLSEDDLIARFGEPLSKGPLEEGVTVYNYVMPMSKEPPNDTSAYCGFAVYCKNGKVMDVNIIRGSDLRN